MAARQEWKRLMKECKDMWELRTADLYNPSPCVLYDAYLVNLSHTLAARLSLICGKQVRVNLRQGKPFKKMQISVTTVHQTKFRLTKLGNGFGYGTVENLSPEDAFLKTIFDRQSVELRGKRRLPGQRETLAQIVPPIVKRAPKPVQDSLKALHLSCRRGVPIDCNGLPIVVEQKKSKAKSSYQWSHKNVQDDSARQLVSHKIYNHGSQLSKKKNKVATLSPLRLKGRDWIVKVEELIEKFDESFRQNDCQQNKIREAQQELRAAKDHILLRLAQEGDQMLFESEESSQNSSLVACSDSEDQETPQRPESYLPKNLQQGPMTEEQKQQYHSMCVDLFEKYSKLSSLASHALDNRWDTRQELMKMAKPSNIVSVGSLQNSKKSFKRNRKLDTQILNERSGELFGGPSSQRLSPQDLFKHLEQLSIQKEAKRVRQPPSFASTAEKQVQQIRGQREQPQSTSAEGHSSLNASAISFTRQRAAKVKSIITHTKEETLQQGQITTGKEHLTPKAQLPKTLPIKESRRTKVSLNNRDIETVIASPLKSSPKKLAASITSSTAGIGGTIKGPVAHQTVTTFKNPEPLLVASETNKTGKTKSPQQKHTTQTQRGLSKDMFKTMQGDVSMREDSIDVGKTGSQEDPMMITASALGSGDSLQGHQMASNSEIVAILDEAEETETVQRPSILKTMQLSITAKKHKQQPRPSDSQMQMEHSQPKSLHEATGSDAQTASCLKPLTQSPSTAEKLSLKALVEQRHLMNKPRTKKPPVPSFSVPPKLRMPMGRQAAQLNGIKSVKGRLMSKLDLKPIEHTTEPKFVPNPHLFERFRTTFRTQTRKSKETLLEEEAVSPFQMMLDEMKKKELKGGEGVARPTIQELEDDFRVGEMTVEDGPELRASYAYFEEQLENIMKQTTSTVFADAADGMRQTMMTNEMGMTLTNKLGQTSKEIGLASFKDSHRRPYFKNQPPLQDTYTRMLEAKFQATEIQFQRRAQQLVQDVRLAEQMAVSPRNKLKPEVSPTQRTSPFQMLQTQASGFKLRNTSTKLFDSNSMSLKEQLRALKFQEANQKDKGATQTGWHRRGNTDLTSAMNPAMDRTGYGDSMSRNNLTTQQQNPFEVVSVRTPVRSARGMSLPQQFNIGQSAVSQADTIDQNSVKYTFKQFKQDSQRDHTRVLLPSVSKIN